MYYAVFATNDTYAMTHSGAILQRVFTPLRFRECPFYQSFQSPYSIIRPKIFWKIILSKLLYVDSQTDSQKNEN